MKLTALLATTAAALWLAAGPASAQDFQVGTRVKIGSTGDVGTVIAVGPPYADGGANIKVHLDKLGAAYPQVGVWYDTAMSNVTPIGGGPAPGAAPGPGQAPAAAPQAPAQPAARPTPPPPLINPAGQQTASAALCQQLIRANYPPTGADQTITVSFLNYSMSGPRPYEAIYANDLAPPAGRGHTVTAWPVHAKFTVLTHYEDPQADDELRTYDAQYMCYRSAAGEWTVEMTSRLPGGETAQYIHKG
jgi:hypothetical protein